MWMTRHDAGRRPRPLVTALWVSTAVLVVAYAASTVLRGADNPSTFWDAWVGNLGYGGCAVLCAARAVSVRRERTAWAFLAAAAALFTLGAVLWTTTVQYWDPVPYPSIADAAFLVFYPVAFVGVGLLAREQLPRKSPGIWFDGLIAALGFSAVEAALVIGPISSRNRGDAATVATNLAYPIGDLVLLFMVVGMVSLMGWRPPVRWSVLGAGLLVFAAADSIYVLRVTSGTYVTGTPLDSLWLIGSFLIGTAAWIGSPAIARAAQRRTPVVVPALFTASSLAIVLVATVDDVLPLAVVLASTTLLFAVARLGQAHHQLGVLASQAHDLLEAAPEAMVCIEADGAIALANAQAHALFRCPPEELLGLPIGDLLPGAVAAHRKIRADLATGRGGTQSVTFDDPVEGRRLDGTTFPGELRLGAVETPRGVLVSISVRDIGRRLALLHEQEELRAQAARDLVERQMLRTQRMESLGQLAGGVAHDFNNLLAAIRGFSTLVAEDLEQADLADPEHRLAPILDDVREIECATRRAAKLTRELLAFARRDEAHPSVVELDGVVEDLEQLLRRTIGEHVALHLDLEAIGGRVLVDVGHLEQVVVNLVVNARDAMPRGGRLTVATDVLHAGDPDPSGMPSGSWVRLRVVDEGCGMDEATLERAFEPFFTTKGEGVGTGLGLATVYGIVRRNGGHTLLESTPGVGTIVTVLVPLTDETVSDAVEVAPEVVPGHGETILLVEDDGATREATRRLLVRHGYHVLAAAGGDDALAQAQGSADPIHLLLTDVIMPGMHGPELAQRLLLSQPSTAVVFMSGHTNGFLDMAGGLDAGAELLAKPYSREELLSAVGKALTLVGSAPQIERWTPSQYGSRSLRL